MFRDRLEVIASFEHLSEQIPESLPSLRGHVSASLTVLRCLEGAILSQGDYIQQTLGLPLTAIPEDYVESARQEVLEALGQLGERQPALSKLPLEQNPGEAIDNALSEVPELIQAIASYLGLENLSLPYRVETVSSSAYWKSWIIGHYTTGLLIRFNCTPRRPYYAGDSICLALHEICGHGLQMMERHALIASGELSNAHGITSVFAPEQFIFEGVAQTVVDWTARLGILSVGRELRFARFYERLRVFVYHNAHCMLIAGATPRVIGEYIKHQLPAESQDTIDKEIQDRTAHPFFRAYLFVYGISDYAFSRLISSIDLAQMPDQLTKWFKWPNTGRHWLESNGFAFTDIPDTFSESLLALPS